MFPLPEGIDWSGVVDSDADSVELKMLLALDGAPVPTESGRRRGARRVYLLDTPDLTLCRAGVHLRVRRRGTRRDELVVRVRDRGRLNGRRGPREARVELDVLPGSLLRTTELRGVVDPETAAACLDADAPLRRLLSDAQRRWLCTLLGEGVPETVIDELVLHGPLTTHRYRVPRARFAVGRAFLEHCHYPSGRELREVSVKCRPADAPRAAVALARFLADHDIAVADGHRTKTALWIEEICRDVGGAADTDRPLGDRQPVT
ncbi:hypothetical protein [Actinomycetospora termitidis]|uniref:CYTH domain-containing protein n=1 Tax=Actinomycetospora termitidis TaxID=3053470 RepID=A0ABT7M6M9_9PSEU|nr:hypothetical protein [Actinomycetospora sp. Odt1-22]MDL5155712.1 hypothetical protein [Actinomycetospora sp. Odt1-22]